MSEAVKSKKGRSEWHYLVKTKVEQDGSGSWLTLEQGDLTTLDNLHSTLPFQKSAYHKSELKKEEEEIFEHYKDWMEFNDHRFETNPEEGTRFYDLDQVLYYDLMGLIPRKSFPPGAPADHDANLRRG